MKKIVSFLIALVTVFTSCFVYAPALDTRLRKVVVLDPGHGGSDPGASGIGCNEADLNWNITIACKEELEKFGIKVYLTRTENQTLKSLSERSKVAKEKNADVLVSIHCNSYINENAHGTEVYQSIHEEKRFGKLAYDVIDILTKDIGTKSRGVKTRLMSDGTDDYYGVIRTCDRPAILVECAFITSPADIDKIASAEGKIKAGKAIAHGILKQYGIDYTQEPEKIIPHDIIKGEKEAGINRFFENQWPEFKKYGSKHLETSVFYNNGSLFAAIKTKDITDNFNKDKLIFAISPYDDNIFDFSYDSVSKSKNSFVFEISKSEKNIGIKYVSKGTDVKNNIKDYISANIISDNNGDIYLLKIDYEKLTGNKFNLDDAYFIDGVLIDNNANYTLIDNGNYKENFECTINNSSKNLFKIGKKSFVWYPDNVPSVDIKIKDSELIKNIDYNSEEAVITPISEIPTFEFEIDTPNNYELYYDYGCQHRIYQPISLKDDRIIVYALVNDKKYKIRIQKEIEKLNFDDLERDSWYYRYVDKVISNGILKGYLEDGKVLLKPDNNATRIESAIFVLKYLGVDVSAFKDTKLPYCDLKDSQKWAEDYLKAAYKLGLMKGEEIDGKYYVHGNSGITRGEFFALLARAIMTMDNDESYKKANFDNFIDKKEIERLSWFENEFKYLVYNNIVNGNGGKFDPLGYITRSQIIKLLAVS